MANLEITKLKIPKTIKCFVDGKFIRTESGRSIPYYRHGTEELFANLSRASRKDLRNAVEAAKKAQSPWAARSAFNRAQILYRAAEMLEGKRQEFADVFIQTLGYDMDKAQLAVDQGIDAFIYYAGFADKFAQVLGCVNPVSGPHHNFTAPEAIGVVGLIASEEFHFGKLIAHMSAALCTGNTMVVLLHGEGTSVLGPLSEVFATSDFPAGVVNLLTGYLDELASHFGSHMEIEALAYAGTNAELHSSLKTLGVSHMKRVVRPAAEAESIQQITNFVEFKTIWHPIGC